MAGVELKGVRKEFGDHKVIHGIDLSIDDGEFVVFVGPSGCGKSTLLRLICGLEPISGGSVAIGGKPMRGVPPDKRGVAMVFQSYALYPHKTVADNMAFSLLMQGVPRAQRQKRVVEVAETLQLTPLLDRLPRQLSGGQRQRVAIGRAIVRDPQVFLFDEPLSNLDAELRFQMRLEIAKLHKQLGATMIYVTHDQMEAMTLADRIVVLRDGRIEQTGRPNEIYDAPVNRFVAGFIGKMSFLTAQVVQQEGSRLTLQVPGSTQATVQMELQDARSVPQELVIGVRPEHFGESHSGPGLLVDIEFVEQLGGESYLHAPSHPAGAVIMRQSEGGAARTGAREIAVNWARTHLFAPDGAALPLRRP